MKKFSILILSALIAIPMNSYSQLITFEKGDSVNAVDFNHNFNHIKNILRFKQKEINISSINSNTLISKILLENIISDIQAQGINVPIQPTLLNTIESENLNNLFKTLEDSSLSHSEPIPVVQNATHQIDLKHDITNYSSNFIIKQNPQFGSLNISNGVLTYQPVKNYLGVDSLILEATDGFLKDKEIKLDFIVDGEGIVTDTSSVRTYHDGSMALSCNDYKTIINGKKKYQGEVGSGLYKIYYGANSQVVYCDMTKDSGGWTLLAAGGSNCSSFTQRNSNSAVYNEHANYGANCGFISELAVKSIASVSNHIELRAGASSTQYSTAVSTSIKPILSLRNSTSWHPNNAYLDFSSPWIWSHSCAAGTIANYKFPELFHGCNYTNAVHWLSGTKHSHSYNSLPAKSSTWIK